MIIHATNVTLTFNLTKICDFNNLDYRKLINRQYDKHSQITAIPLTAQYNKFVMYDNKSNRH